MINHNTIIRLAFIFSLPKTSSVSTDRFGIVSMVATAGRNLLQNTKWLLVPYFFPILTLLPVYLAFQDKAGTNEPVNTSSFNIDIFKPLNIALVITTELLASATDVYMLKKIMKSRICLEQRLPSSPSSPAQLDSSLQSSTSSLVQSLRANPFAKTLVTSYIVIWSLIVFDIVIKVLIVEHFPLLFDSAVTLFSLAMRARTNLIYGLTVTAVFDGAHCKSNSNNNNHNAFNSNKSSNSSLSSSTSCSGSPVITNSRMLRGDPFISSPFQVQLNKDAVLLMDASSSGIVNIKGDGGGGHPKVLATTVLDCEDQAGETTTAPAAFTVITPPPDSLSRASRVSTIHGIAFDSDFSVRTDLTSSPASTTLRKFDSVYSSVDTEATTSTSSNYHFFQNHLPRHHPPPPTSSTPAGSNKALSTYSSATAANTVISSASRWSASQRSNVFPLVLEQRSSAIMKRLSPPE